TTLGRTEQGAGLAIRTRSHLMDFASGSQFGLPKLLSFRGSISSDLPPFRDQKRLVVERGERRLVAVSLPPVLRPKQPARPVPYPQPEAASGSHPRAIRGNREVSDPVLEDTGKKTMQQTLGQSIKCKPPFGLAVRPGQIKVVAFGRLKIESL